MSAKKQYKSANKKAKKDYYAALKDVNKVKAEIGKVLGNVSGKETEGYDATKSAIEAANAALQTGMSQTTAQNTQGIQDELSRMGLGAVGVGGIGTNAAMAALFANQAGLNDVQNLDTRRRNTTDLAKDYLGVNTNMREQEIKDRRRNYFDILEQNKEAYKQARAYEKQQAAYARRFGGGYGGGGYGANGFAAQQAAQRNAEAERQRRALIAATNIKRQKLGVKGGLWAGTKTPWNSTMN